MHACIRKGAQHGYALGGGQCSYRPCSVRSVIVIGGKIIVTTHISIGCDEADVAPASGGLDNAVEAGVNRRGAPAPHIALSTAGYRSSSIGSSGYLNDVLGAAQRAASEAEEPEDKGQR